MEFSPFWHFNAHPGIRFSPPSSPVGQRCWILSSRCFVPGVNSHWFFCSYWFLFKALYCFINLLSTSEEFRDLLAEYADVISSKGFSGTVPKHPVLHSDPTVLCSLPSSLVHPDPSAKITLSEDASGSHIRAVLQQEVAGLWAPLTFYSKKLSSAESRYSAFDQELFAAYSALHHFCVLLAGKEFVLFNALSHPDPTHSPPMPKSPHTCDVLMSKVSEVMEVLEVPEV